jgi:predicted ATPase/class 3 adenylate cyclase
MRELPTGTVTFFFSDVEGSTRLLQEMGREDYGRLQDAHAAIVRSAVVEGGGVEIRTEGDSFFVVFPSAAAALRTAVAAQRGLASHTWYGPDIRVRIGLHTGEGIPGGDDYTGIEVNRAARIAATGHGGQVVVSSTTRSLVESELPEDVFLRDLGAHRLKDFEDPEHLHDLVIDGLDDEFPPLSTLDPRRTNLPPERTSFVGRDDAIAELDALLDDHRLVTITGPGGTGKTRLALKVASARVDRHEGVYFVDLSAVRESAFIVPEIARALRIRDAPGIDLADALREHLREIDLLLVLDNMEQLASDASPVGMLLDGSPGLRVLVTSRIVLHLAGEHEYPAAPLTLPDPTLTDPEAVASTDAVRLFVERAAATRPGFEVTGENSAAVAEIVARVDGLPLALELASSKLRVLDPAGLADRLEQRLPLLTGGARDAPARHRTLAETIRWSEEALPDNERLLLAHLSVFAGGFTMEAAESVMGDRLDVLNGLGTLVDNSLLRRVEAAPGSLRFAMLETIREYAAARFAERDDAERANTERRHARYVLELAERAEPHLNRERQLEWLSTLEREHESIRAALDHALSASDPDDVGTGLRTAAALWRFFQQRAHLAEGRSRLEALLALPEASPRDTARALALGALGSIDYWLNDYAPMQASYEEAASIAEEVGDRRLLARSLFNLSFVPVATGHIEEAVPLLERCLEVADADDTSLRAQVWTSLGTLPLLAGDAQRAMPGLERALEILRLADERLASCEVLIMCAGAELMLGSLEASFGHLAAATAIATSSGSPLLLANVVIPHAIAANVTGQPERAARLVGAWNRLEEDYEIHFPAIGLGLFGDFAGDARAALGDEAFERARQEGLALNLQGIVGLIEAVSL